MIGDTYRIAGREFVSFDIAATHVAAQVRAERWKRLGWITHYRVRPRRAGMAGFYVLVHPEPPQGALAATPPAGAEGGKGS